MIKSDALSCPICEDYYDDIAKTGIRHNSDGTVTIQSGSYSNTITDTITYPTYGERSDTPETLELRKKIKSLKTELYQQRFNNEKNLSIDGVIADKIKELQTQNIALIDYLELMMLHKDTEIFEAEVKEYIKGIE
jgi:hypothetical protein